jgi:murein DD-endopeptidase MepM/ murein hydrolase activator NlpD
MARRRCRVHRATSRPQTSEPASHKHFRMARRRQRPRWRGDDLSSDAVRAHETYTGTLFALAVHPRGHSRRSNIAGEWRQAVVMSDEDKASQGALGGNRPITRPRMGPPALMCFGACVLVLALADYRTGEESLRAAMQPPEYAVAASTAGRPARQSWIASAKTDPAGVALGESRSSPLASVVAADATLPGIDVDPYDLLAASHDQGALIVRRAAMPLGRRVRAVAGAVDTTFTSAALRAGAPESIVAQVADVFGWEIDFRRQLAPGARFRIVYDETSEHGQTQTGRLLAAQIEAGGALHEAFYYAPGVRQEGGYFDAEGRAIEGRFLRYPVSFTRISSFFSEWRLHPILKIHLPHYGVDFAAPTGTPVRAVAAGTVVKAGWHGGAGRFVKLEHDARHQTGYAHLSRIAAGIAPGAHVRKGETIGYVGQSGLATGPHLHFALYIEGRYADPLKAHLPHARSLHGARLAAFRDGLAGMNRVLAAADRKADGEPIVTASAR